MKADLKILVKIIMMANIITLGTSYGADAVTKWKIMTARYRDRAILQLLVNLLIKTYFHLLDIHGPVRWEVIKSRSLSFIEMLKRWICGSNATVCELFFGKSFP